MALLLMTYDFASIPDSLQVGDTGYYASTYGSVGGFSTGSSIVAFGVVNTVDRAALTVTFVVDNTSTNSISPDVSPPTQAHFIMFGKNKVVNSSGLLGYYAEVKFVNNSTEYAELFSVGSEISQSSK